MLICITGMPLAGKTLVAGVARERGVPVINMGDVIREEAKRRGIEATPENFRRLMTELRREKGEAAVAELSIEKLKQAFKSGHRIVVVEGLRSMAEWRLFKENFKGCVLLAVHASPKTRFKRALIRGRPDDPRSFEEFMARDLLELEIGIGWLIALADYMIVNEGPAEETLTVAKKLFKELMSSVEG